MVSVLHKKITKLAVDQLNVGDVIRDTELKGFGARRQQGAPSYFLQKNVRGRVRWFTIGPHGAPWTAETARREAYRLIGELSGGKDPGEERRVERDKPTFAEAAPLFMADHGPKLKPRTRIEYEKLFRTYLVPAFGKRRFTDITRAEIARFHARMADKSSAANFCLAVLSRMMRWAEDNGFRPVNSNPCKGVKKFRQNKRERYLSPDEFARLGKVLNQVDSDGSHSIFALSAIRLLILTGARHSEILTLKWQFVDLERGLLILPESKTGQKSIRLSPSAIDVLKAIPRVYENPYVIIGKRNGTHMVNLHKSWVDIRTRAGLAEVRIHDLRHSFASVAAASGASLAMIGKLLGHADTQTTARYAHLADDPMRKLNDEIGDAISKAMVRGKS